MTDRSHARRLVFALCSLLVVSACGFAGPMGGRDGGGGSAQGGAGGAPTGMGGRSGGAGGRGGTTGSGGTGGGGGASPGADVGVPDRQPDDGGATRDAAAEAGTQRDSAPTTSDGAADAPGGGKPPSGVIGWAAVRCGPNGTTGGEGGPTTMVTNADDLAKAARATGKRIIQISGRITVETLNVSEGDATFVGVNGAEILGGVTVRASNVIFKNIKFNGASAGGDPMEVTGATCVWIDHCEFVDGNDGNLDIVPGSNLITVSWSKFHYVQRTHDHRFSNLCGNSDSDTPDKINITFHHNWAGAKVHERMPRVRQGKVHIFNNYSSTGNNYAVGAGYMAKLLVENNVFDGVEDPIRFHSDDDTAQVVERGNDYTTANGSHVSRGAAFVPPYPYAPQPASEVKAAVMAGAGVK